MIKIMVFQLKKYHFAFNKLKQIQKDYMKEEKTTQELIDEFLAKGGEIEVLEAIKPEEKKLVKSTTKKAPELMTLP